MASRGNGRNNKPQINIDFKEIISKIIEYARENTRYCVAAGLLVVMMIVLAVCAAPKSSSDDVESTEYTSPAEADFEIGTNEQINNLITEYYTAYAAGDLDTLGTLATPIAENEKTYISMFSQYVEEYQNITCYTKNGLDSSSYMVYVSMEVKFTGVDTAAPGLEFYYVRTSDDGSLYIDNLYSPYNLANKENALDTSVQNLLQELINQEDAIALQEETQQSYDAAVASDSALSEMVTVTIPGEISTWKDAVVAAASSTETTETTEEGTETTEETPTEETPAEESTSETVYTTDKVNVRVSASTSADKLGSAAKGTSLTRTGTDGEWSIVEYEGYTGYIKSEFLTTEEPSATTTTTDSGTANNAIAAGTVITITTSTNIRSEMSETSSKIGTAYNGEKVTVVQSYSEGWTKVTWNNKTGYIKTSLLQ